LHRLRHAYPFAALAALLAAVHHRILFLGETFVLRDAVRFRTLPSRQALVSALSAGRVPEWLDAVGFGVPFAANPVHGVVAPLGWTLGLLPAEAGPDLYAFLHLLLAAAGAAAFSRRLGASLAGAVFAGAALATGGYACSAVANGMAHNLAWTPWVAWAADRLARPARPGASPLQHGLVLAAALALQLLAGEPASVIIAALVALAVILARAPRPAPAVVGLGIAGIAAAALAAVALVPGFALLGASSRAGGLSVQASAAWSMHPLRVIEWFWPLAFGAPGGEGWLARVLLPDGPGEPCWSFSLAVGAPVLVLAFAVRERWARWLLLGSAVFVLLALGNHTPLHPLYRQLCPRERLARYPEKYVYGALLLWSALAGVGFTAQVEGRPGRLAVTTAAAAALLLAAGSAALAQIRGAAAAWVGARAAAMGIPLDPALGIDLAVHGGALAAGGAAAFALALALRRTRPGGRLAPILAAAGALLPLVVTGWIATPLAHREVVERRPGLLAAFPPSLPTARGPLPRLFRAPNASEQTRFADGDEIATYFQETLSVNVAARFGVDVIPGYDPASSPRFNRLWDEIFPRMTWEGLTGLLGVQYLALEDPLVPQTGLAPAAHSALGWSLVPARRVRPRAFVAPRWRIARSADDALSDLATPGRAADLAAVTLVAGEAPAGSGAAGALAPCAIERRRPEEIHLRCDTATGGVAVLLEELAPGWTAEVDGRDVPALVAEGLFRAAAVGPGAHEVVFRYRTPGLRSGAIVSLVAWSAWGLLLLASARPRQGAVPERS